MKAIFYFGWITLALTNVISMVAGGPWLLLTPALAFLILPLADYAMGEASVDTADTTRHALFKNNLYLYTAIQFLIFFGWLTWIGFGEPTAGDILLASLAFGIMSGALGITTSHELMHKPNRLDGVLARLLLLNVCYMHYVIEHLLGHHHRVATADDPATARFGESVYRFLPRTLWGSYRHAWELELLRLQKRKRPVLSHHNNMLWYGLWPLAMLVLIGTLFGGKGAAFYLLQSLIAVTLLEIANYMEHYGLTRKLLDNGRYEKFSAAHAWNANQRVSNGMLFGLQRHPDHHLHPLRPYEELKSCAESPQLPFGYPTMFLIAFIPPLWRLVMHPRMASFKKAQAQQP